MDSIEEKLKTTLDVESQSFEVERANPYEIAVATAKYAREINERARKYLGSDVDIYPRSLALQKFDDEQTSIVYDADETVESAKDENASKPSKSENG